MIKVERSYPAPPSLAVEERKNNGQYNLEDVVARLRKDFHGKCYICEMRPVFDPEVEHRLPHKGGRISGRKYNWDNLFYSCRHCNSVKNQSKYDEGIIDCCKDDPEEYLSYTFDDKGVYTYAIDPDNKEARLTAELIDEVFNLTNTGIRLIACQERTEQLQKEMNKLYITLARYKSRPDSKLINKNLRVLLRRESAFAGCKRDYVRKHLSEYPLLETYLA